MIPEPKPAASNNRAVVALLGQAQASTLAGKHEAAGASLERALRIEPRNPWLWLELAQVRLAEGQYAQAITLARKSNSFAGGQHAVQSGNWEVIGKALVALGDSTGAEQAFRLSAEQVQQGQAATQNLQTGPSPAPSAAQPATPAANPPVVPR